jgi:pimeloyl-ACP methyl ester carboxylesterase
MAATRLVGANPGGRETQASFRRGEAMPQAHVQGPEPITLEGRQGARYWVHLPCELTGHRAVDAAISGYPLVVFQPSGRDPRRTPVVIGLQGMAMPLAENGFLVPTLLDMGIACVLFDTPLAGERSLIRDPHSNAIRQIVSLVRHDVPFTTRTVVSLVDVVARDFAAVRDILHQRHGLNDDRLALFGVSLGCLLSSHAFMRDGLGARLLGVIGHADLHLFARSYAPFFTPVLASLPARVAGKMLTWFRRRYLAAAVRFLSVLQDLRCGGAACMEANPMSYVNRVGPGRRVRFLVGDEDRRVRHQDAETCSRRFHDGQCYLVPGLGHGFTSFGPSFVEHVRTFIGTQLGDWRW